MSTITDPSSAGPCSEVSSSLGEVSTPEVVMVEIRFIRTLLAKKGWRTRSPTGEGTSIVTAAASPRETRQGAGVKLFLQNDLWRKRRGRREPRQQLSSASNDGLRPAAGLPMVPP